MAVVEFEVSDEIAHIRLNRPEALNTMTSELLDGLLSALEAAAADDAVRAVILTGTGRAFCAGGDLQGMASRSSGAAADATIEHAIAALRRSMRSSELLRDMPKVTFAAINGACAGAGLALACAADIRYCAQSAMFNTAFMTAGLPGDFGGSWTLPRIVGPGRARELFLMAEKFGAADAERFGLVSAALPDGELMDFVRGRALRAAGLAPLTIRAAKANLNAAQQLDFPGLLDLEADRQIRIGRTADAREAARAFLEKRKPVFQGR